MEVVTISSLVPVRLFPSTLSETVLLLVDVNGEDVLKGGAGVDVLNKGTDIAISREFSAVRRDSWKSGSDNAK